MDCLRATAIFGLLFSYFLQLEAASETTPSNAGSVTSNTEVMEQVFQIVKEIIETQKEFQTSVAQELEDLRKTQSEINSKLFAEVEATGNMQLKIRKLSNTLQSLPLKQNAAEFYPKKITLYKEYLNGQAWDLQVPTNPSICTSIPSDAFHRVSSIETNGNCVILFKERNCSGRAIRFEDYTYGYDNFGRISFHDQPKAFKSC